MVSLVPLSYETDAESITTSSYLGTPLFTAVVPSLSNTLPLVWIVPPFVEVVSLDMVAVPVTEPADISVKVVDDAYNGLNNPVIFVVTSYVVSNK